MVGIGPIIGETLPDFKSAAWTELLKKFAELEWQIEIHCEARHLPQIVDPFCWNRASIS